MYAGHIVTSIPPNDTKLSRSKYGEVQCIRTINVYFIVLN